MWFIPKDFSKDLDALTEAVSSAITDFFDPYNRSFKEEVYTSNLITSIETCHDNVKYVIMNKPTTYVTQLLSNQFPKLGELTVTIGSV